MFIRSSFNKLHVRVPPAACGFPLQRLRADETHFPDTVAHIFVVNAPWVFYALHPGRADTWKVAVCFAIGTHNVA